MIERKGTAGTDGAMESKQNPGSSGGPLPATEESDRLRLQVGNSHRTSIMRRVPVSPCNAAAGQKGPGVLGRGIESLVVGMAAFFSIPTSAAWAQTRWVVDSLPSVDIHGLSAKGAALLEEPVAGVRQRDGTIVIAEGRTARISFFNGGGRVLRTVGRSGDGPGEYRLISWLGQCAGDSIFVWDFIHQRLTALDKDGQLGREMMIPSSGRIDPPPYLIRCNRKGQFAVHDQPSLSDPPKPGVASTRERTKLRVVNGRDSTLAVIGMIPSTEYSLTRIGAAVPRPLGRVPTVAMTDDRLYVGTADSGVIAVFALSGRPRGAIRVPVQPRAPTRVQYEASADALVIYQSDARTREAMKKLMLELPMPATVPPYTALFTAPAGTLWVSLYVPGDFETQLLAFRGDGYPQGQVRIPIGLTVFDIGDDYVLGTYEDRAGEPHVVLYRLHRQ
jgi:hypothetical protein